MSKVFDTLVLNTIWVLLCLPLPAMTIVWIGQTGKLYFLILTVFATLPIVPATTALYYALVKSVRRERGYATKEYFRSFKCNFKQGAVFSFIALLFVLVLYFDFDYAWDLVKAGESSGSTYLGIFIVIAFLFCTIFAYVCPILSRFDMGVISILKTAFVMGIRHLLTTIILIILFAGVLVGSYVMQPLGMFFLPAVGMLLATLLIEKVFKHYMPEKEEIVIGEDGEEVGRDKDEWYLE